jgi:hypothetical protein
MKPLLVAMVLSAAGCGGASVLPTPAKPPAKPAAAKVAVPPAAPATGPAQDVIRQKAAVGMGEAGRGYGEGIVATPVKALWFTKERLVLVQIEHDLQLFKAQDPQGHGPKSHEEFMEKIIKAGGIRLPALPAGQRYVYDPAKEELQVEQPRPQ